MSNTLHPASLFIGSRLDIESYLENYLKKALCSNNVCNSCIDCRNIEKKQHHLVRWLTPEGQYTIAQLDVIFKTIIYTLEPDQKFFFIINQAELLNLTCANSLLKSLEEPPAGYHFILIANKKENLLPTIVSRCLIHDFSFVQIQNHVLFDYFTFKLDFNNKDFNKLLDNTKFTEIESLNFIDQLYEYWLEAYKNSLISDDQEKIIKSQKIIKVLDQARLTPAMPGSTKIFLKNLFLQIL